MTSNQSTTPITTRARMHYEDLLFERSMSAHICSYIPNSVTECVIVCIGTDRCTGDALGPLVGTYLSEMKPTQFTIYGTIHSPVHAKNLDETMKYIHKNHHKPFIIAIDASLGKVSSIGSVISGQGSLQPGSALKKSLPKVGDVYIAGIVNVSGFMELAVLQNTRLSIVMDMAQAIASVLYRVDKHLRVANNNGFSDVHDKHKNKAYNDNSW